MKKNIIAGSTIILLLLAMSIGLYNSNNTDKPKPTLDKFFKGVSTLNHQQIKENLAEPLYNKLEVDVIETYDNLIGENIENLNDIKKTKANLRKLYKPLSYKIIDLKYNDNKNKVKVKVNIQHSELTKLINKSFVDTKEIIHKNESYTSLERFQSLINSFNENSNMKVNTIINEGYIKLQKEKKGWTIYEIDENVKSFLVFDSLNLIEDFINNNIIENNEHIKNVKVVIKGSKNTTTINLQTKSNTLENLLKEYYKPNDLLTVKTKYGIIIKSIKEDISNGEYNWVVTSNNEYIKNNLVNYIDKVNINNNSSFTIEFKKESK